MALQRTGGFPTFVNQQLPLAVVGDFASMNPRAVALAGAGQFRAADGSTSLLTALVAPVVVGNFAWAFSDGLAYGNKHSPAALGFIANELQTVITQFLGVFRLTVQAGFPVTLYSYGDFFANVASVSGSVAVGDSIFADQFTGAPTTFNGVAVVTAVQTAAAAVMSVTAVTSGALGVGATLSGTGVDSGLTIVNQLTSTETDGHFGGKGTYTVSTTTGFASTTVTSNAQNPDTLFKAASSSVADASFTGAIAAATGVLTISGITGTVAVGQFLQGVGSPQNSYIQSFISGTGGNGTYQINYNGPAVGATAMTSTEGKLVKITRPA